ncbi:hypothetical protein DERP_007013 [Dermatophagoides pteronyssinus]|uniref:Uncharacterized protein n=1 Tax=Dermatophagoides pteronyssinus TaxID=6956 RepID=A0ABQ8JTX2_DERPT|nr:hypothetical protein DERP_007013 [Dermatophagoides pteronyssinus]
MKFVQIFTVTIVAAIVIGLAYAENDDKQKKIEDAEELIKHAREFLKEKKMNIKNAKEILAMRAQIGIILAIIGELHAANDEKSLKDVYEQLRTHEQKLLDEMAHFGQHSTTEAIEIGENNREKLIQRGEKLLQRAKEFQRKHHNDHSIEQERIHEEINVVKTLVDELKRSHDKHGEVEETLEKMLEIHENVLEKMMNDYGKHSTPYYPTTTTETTKA